MRSYNRTNDKIRPIKIATGFTKFAEGSVLIETGDTRVLCNASVEESVPPFLRGTGTGWVTAEYDMLPRATQTRNARDISKLKLKSRSAEISRLIGRSLRSVIDLNLLGERSIVIDCDVLQADGGTRTASITGGYVALELACKGLLEKKLISKFPLRGRVAAVSAGIVDGKLLLDLDYSEDSRAEADVNLVMTEAGEIVEVQGTGEKRPFSVDELSGLIKLCGKGISELCAIQRTSLGEKL
jgi:ribonuclease PH